MPGPGDRRVSRNRARNDKPKSEASARFGYALSRRSAIWLGTLSTVVGIATGMFTLRDQVFPGESGNAQASLPQYQQSVGEICDHLNRAERARAWDARSLARQLPHARTTDGQRRIIMDGARKSLGRSAHEVALFQGLLIPPKMSARHHATAAAWNRNIERIRTYIERLDRVVTRRELYAAINVLADMRSALGKDGVTVQAGLNNLGGGRCHLDPPIVEQTITLPKAPHHVRPPTPRRTNPPSGQAPQPTPQATQPSRVNSPSGQTPQPTQPVRVNPPSGQVVGGGGDGGGG
jgi:hypothetical protein